jgi:hypothetical protein
MQSALLVINQSIPLAEKALAFLGLEKQPRFEELESGARYSAAEHPMLVKLKNI